MVVREQNGSTKVHIKPKGMFTPNESGSKSEKDQS